MSGDRPTITVGVEQIDTTPLGKLCFEGTEAEISTAMGGTPDWKKEGVHPLHGALYASRMGLALALFRRGAPFDEDTYFIAFRFCREFLPNLPPRPELVADLVRKQAQSDFNWALLDGDLVQAQALFQLGPPLAESFPLTESMGAQYPLHYAARSGKSEVILFVARLGVDLNVLTPDGCSAMRIIAEHFDLSRTERKELLRVLKELGGEIIPPPASVGDKLRVWRGERLGSESR